MIATVSDHAFAATSATGLKLVRLCHGRTTLNLPSSHRTTALHVRTSQADLRTTCAIRTIHGSFGAYISRGKSHTARSPWQREVRFRSHRRLTASHCSNRNWLQRELCDESRIYGYRGGIAIDLAADTGTNRSYGWRISERRWCVERDRWQSHGTWRFTGHLNARLIPMAGHECDFLKSLVGSRRRKWQGSDKCTGIICR